MSILKILRESGKKKIKQKLFLIPFLFTFLNAFFGLLSVVNTLDQQVVLAAYCILLAACMDFLDGRLARAFGSCSYLGMELDSLCDAISFCFAPAVLLYGWSLHAYGATGLLAVGLYLCSGLLRLAKFNAMIMNQKSYFIGLPTTIAAFFIANMVISSGWLATSHLSGLVSAWGLIVVLALLSFLMLSVMQFASLKVCKMSGIISYVAVIAVIITSIVCVNAGCPIVFFATCIYIMSNVVINGRCMLRLFTPKGC